MLLIYHANKKIDVKGTILIHYVVTHTLCNWPLKCALAVLETRKLSVAVYSHTKPNCFQKLNT